MRTVKIKAANVKGNYDLIMAVKNTEFRNKLMYYYATFLNSFKNNSTTIDALRYFVVFQMGMFRISIQTGYTFEAMEIVYATLANKELPSYMTAKADPVEA